MTRILHLRSSCGLYGADRALLELAAATPAPFEAVVGSIVRPEREDALSAEAERRGLPYLQVESRGRLDLASGRWLAEKVRSEGFGLLHAHDYKSLSLAAWVAARTQVPVVATFHGDTGATPALRAYEALARLLGNTTSGVAAVSDALAQKLRRWVLASAVHHIPNGIRLANPCSEDERSAAKQMLGIADDRQVVAVIGRLSIEKGHVHLFRALKALPRPPVLLVAGEGPLEDALRAVSTGLDIRWLGFVRDARAVYSAADLVALPSLTEGLPLVALEAMALGRPLVASAVGELPTLLANGAGVLLTPGDEPAWTAALAQTLSNPDARIAMAERARLRVRESYSLDVMAQRYVQMLYAPALLGRGARLGRSTLSADERAGLG